MNDFSKMTTSDLAHEIISETSDIQGLLFQLQNIQGEISRKTRRVDNMARVIDLRVKGGRDLKTIKEVQNV